MSETFCVFDFSRYGSKEFWRSLIKDPYSEEAGNFVQKLSEEEKFWLMNSLKQKTFLDCDSFFRGVLKNEDLDSSWVKDEIAMLFQMVLLAYDGNASPTLSNVEARELFDELTKNERGQDTSSIAIWNMELDSIIRRFGDNSDLKRMHVFVTNGSHSIPIYLEKTEEGVLALLTDSIANSQGIENVLVRNSYIKTCYTYQCGRQAAGEGCGVFSLRDAIKTFRQQNTDKCLSIFEWIKRGQLTQVGEKKIEFKNLPPAFLKTTQRSLVLPSKNDLAVLSKNLGDVTPQYSTKENGNRVKKHETYENMFETVQNYTVRGRNLLIATKMRKYKCQLYAKFPFEPDEK